MLDEAARAELARWGERSGVDAVEEFARAWSCAWPSSRGYGRVYRVGPRAWRWSRSGHTLTGDLSDGALRIEEASL